MLDIGRVDGGGDRRRGAGKPVRAVAAPDPAGHQKIAVTSGMKLRRAGGTGGFHLDGGLTNRPGDRKIRQVGTGKPVGIADDKRHRLAAESRRGLGKRRLVGEWRDDAEFIDAGNVGGGDDRVDHRPFGRPGLEIPEFEIGKVMRAADGADKARAVGPAVGAEPLADIDLGAPVKTLDSGPDRRAGCRHGGFIGGASGIHHRVDDLGIAGAAAQNAAERVLDRLPVGGGVPAEQGGGRHHHPRRADSALRRAVAKERRLQRRQRAVGAGKRLRGFNMAPGNLPGRNKAGADRITVDQHRAGAAVTGVASNLGGPQRQPLAKHLAQPHRRRAADLPRLAIDGETEVPVSVVQPIHHPASPHNSPTSLATSSAAASRRYPAVPRMSSIGDSAAMIAVPQSRRYAAASSHGIPCNPASMSPSRTATGAQAPTAIAALSILPPADDKPRRGHRDGNHQIAPCPQFRKPEQPVSACAGT